MNEKAYEAAHERLKRIPFIGRGIYSPEQTKAVIDAFLAEFKPIIMLRSPGNLRAAGSENIGSIPEGYVKCYVIPIELVPVQGST